METIENLNIFQLNMNHCKEVNKSVDEHMKANKADIGMLQEPYIQNDNMQALYIEDNLIYKKNNCKQ